MNMKMIFALICTLMSYHIAAQDSPSLDELRKGFVLQYNQHSANPDMKSYDRVIGDSRILTGFLPDERYSYMDVNPKLRRAGKIQIPPSLYLIEPRKSDSDEIVSDFYWIGLRDSMTVAEKKLRERLIKKYGCVMLEDSIPAVPVKWFNGRIRVTSMPDRYGDFLVSTLQLEHSVNNACIVSKDFKAKSILTSSLKTDIAAINRNSSGVVFHTTNPQYREGLRNTSLNLLARDLSRTLQKGGNINSREYHTIPIIITTDAQQKSHIEAVFPDSLQGEDSIRFSELQRAMELQPAGILSCAWTVGGRWFNALFIKATFYESSGRWIFDEYPRVHLWPNFP